MSRRGYLNETGTGAGSGGDPSCKEGPGANPRCGLAGKGSPKGMSGTDRAFQGPVGWIGWISPADRLDELWGSTELKKARGWLAEMCPRLKGRPWAQRPDGTEQVGAAAAV